jgi:amidophosphoribosyltransferase
MELQFEDDTPKENCGVIGLYAPELPDIAQTICLGLIALQHRGQESCGIVTYDDKRDEVHSHKGLGLVSQVFNSEEKLNPLLGKMGIGHTRYATSGKCTIENAQPMIVRTYHGSIAISQNGNLTTQKNLRKKLLERGIGMFRESDIEVIAQLLAANPPGYDATKGPQWEQRISAFMHEADGAYSLAILTKDALFGCRDFCGLRPLCIGVLNLKNPETGKPITRYALASESCALSMLGATYLREVNPGEIVRIDDTGLTSHVGRNPKPALCIFEYVYFARPDSLLEDQLIVKVRERLGKQLAIEAPAPKADIVVGVPDSSVPAARGYALQSGIPYCDGLAKNRYVHRTFIQPTQTLRKLGVSMKFTPVVSELQGKKVVLVDDSIVRGNTIENLVTLLYGAGAAEVHVRVSSPPIRHPCFMGIDMATTDQMVAFDKTEEEVCKLIGATSLRYLSHEGMEKATREGLSQGSESRKGKYCGACFTGNYPVPLDDW